MSKYPCLNAASPDPWSLLNMYALQTRLVDLYLQGLSRVAALSFCVHWSIARFTQLALGGGG